MPIAYQYKFSDFYGYDKDCSTLTSYSSSTMGTFNQVCPINGSNPGLTQTYYHNGSSPSGKPVAGDTCYSDSAGTSVLAAGYYYLGGTGSGNRQYIQISGSNGVVDQFYPDFC